MRLRSICPSENSPRRPISAARRRLKSYITLTQRKFAASLRIARRQEESRVASATVRRPSEGESRAVCLDTVCRVGDQHSAKGLWYSAEVSSSTPTELINEWMNECVLHRRVMLVKCVAHTEQTTNLFTAAKSKGERSFIPFNVNGWGWNCRHSALQSSKGALPIASDNASRVGPNGGKSSASFAVDLFEPSDCASAERGEEGKTASRLTEAKAWFVKQERKLWTLFVVSSVVGITP